MAAMEATTAQALTPQPSDMKKKEIKQEAAEEFSPALLTTALAFEPARRDRDDVEEAVARWLEHLPIIGARLAPELQVPHDLMLEAFLRGKATTCTKGQRLASEGDEVTNYVIVLLGKCRLRCRAPTRPAAKEDDETAIDAATEAAAAGIESDGFVTCGFVGPGEPIGQIPGEQRSSYEVTVVERSTLLLLSADDYAAAFRLHQKDLHAKAAEFLQIHRICPLAKPENLQRIAMSLRSRSVRKGACVSKCGDRQRQIWFLQEGECSILAPEEDIARLGVEGNAEDQALREASDEERELRDRVERMRVAGNDGAEGQQASAAQEKRCGVVLQYACGPLKRTLERWPRPKPPRTASVSAARVLQHPGTPIGEEVLLCDNFYSMISARCCYTVRAEADSTFYVADLSMFRQLAMYAGLENVALMVNEKLNKRSMHMARNESAMRKVNRHTRWLQRREMERLERPQIRLPPSSGVVGPTEVEDVNEWLNVTYKHRKEPLNKMNPPSLSCIEGLGDAGREMVRSGILGPGVQNTIQHFKNEATLLKYREEQRRGYLKRRRPIGSGGNNPMGEFAPPSQKFYDANIAEAGAPASLEDEISMISSGVADTTTGDAGIFFRTEPQLSEMPSLSKLPGPARSLSTPALRPPTNGTSVSELPALEDAASLQNRGGPASVAWANHADFAGLSTAGEEDPSAILVAGSRKMEDASASGPRSRAAARAKAAERQRYVSKCFARAVVEKSILVLTDSSDSRKAVSGAVLEAQSALYFVKSTNELWARLRDKREQHHALILDLTKAELQADSVLRTVRQDAKYCNLPIVVISGERELSDLVRKSCSFVVFKPLVASMLREALLWCFNRRALQGLFSEDSSTR